MKKVTALLLALLMVLAIVGCTSTPAPTPEQPVDQPTEKPAEATAKPDEPAPEPVKVTAEDVVNSPEFETMTLGNFEYGKDYQSLYEVYSAEHPGFTLDDVTEDDDGFGYVQVNGEDHMLGLDFLTMAMVYNNTPTATYPTEEDTYAAWWRLYITRWNYLLPEIPLYSNEYYDLYNAKIKGVEEHPTNPFWGVASALIDWTSEKEDDSLIMGSTTDLSGQFRYSSFGKRSPGSSDNDIDGLINGLETVSANKEGGYQWNDTVVAEHDEKLNDDGTLTYTIKIKDDLLFSDGSPVTAKDYLAFAMAMASPVGTQASGREINYQTVVGWKDAYQKYEGPGSEAGTKEFAAFHLIDDYTFSVTITDEYANYFYRITYGGFSANYAAAWLGEGVEIMDDGNGCYLSDEFYAKDEEGKFIQAAAINKLCTDISAENYAAYPYSGPYCVESFDNSASTAVLVRNENFKGNYEGVKPGIGKIIYRKIVAATQLEDFKAGGLDVIAAITGGAATDEALKAADESKGAYVYTHYSRAGYGKLGMRCDYGPVQFRSVRAAIALCMDRAQFAKDFTGGYGGVVDGPYYKGSWMYKAAVEQGMLLDSYATSADAAIEVLEEDGWVWNADGTPYTGEGIRYKAIPADAINDRDKAYQSMDGAYKVEEVNGVYLMPLVINWFGTVDNEFTDLLQTGFRENANIAAVGMKVYNQTGDFYPMLDELYQQAAYGYYAGTPMYNAFNFATGFNSAAYDYSWYMTIDPTLYDDYSNYYIKDNADVCWLG